MRPVDLNADMGEGFGPWRMGDDAGLMEIVTSANVACGFHAGDPATMARTMGMAFARGVGVGAHPGFGDLQGFGRRRLALSEEELGALVAYQLGAARGIAERAGGRVRHLKLHGALANIASEDAGVARACFAAALAVDPGIVLLVLAATAQERAARDLGAHWAGEIFADRAYNADATLVDRGLPGAVIHDAAAAGPRIAAMLRAGAIIAEGGARIPCRIDSVCVHGDSPDAVALARALRHHLAGEGVTLAPLSPAPR